MAHDVMVIGGGIAGMEASLTLADTGYNVLLVEKSPSIGGNMIELSKVFPTLDCSGCITTPKMSATANHPNITIMSYSEVQEIYKEEEGRFRVKILKKPRYVNLDDCIGCQRCETACPVFIPKEFEYGFVGRKAAYVPFEMASPRKALIDLDNCAMCGKCERACPTNAIDFLQEPETIEEEVKSVIVSTGFKPFDPTVKEEYGYGNFSNVIHGLQMERILAPSRPFNAVVRPSDGKIPEKVAFVLCGFQRQIHRVPYLLQGLLHVFHKAGHSVHLRFTSGGRNCVQHGYQGLRQGIRGVLQHVRGYGFEVRERESGQNR